MLYQAFFCLFFELAKNEEGPEFALLDSLNLYEKEGREVHSHVFYIMAASIVSLNKAPILSLSTIGSQYFDLISIQSFLLLQLVSFPIIWGICQCLLHCRFVSLVLFCVKIFLSHFCVMLTIQGLNLCRRFCSFLDLLCWPFPGIISLHHVFNGPCHEILYQFHIQLVFELPCVG